MNNNNINTLTSNELIKLIDKVKIASGCNEVELIGNHKTFEELMAEGFPLAAFKCTEDLKLDESQLYVIPIREHNNIKIVFEE
jgi:hypothetical protein